MTSNQFSFQRHLPPSLPNSKVPPFLPNSNGNFTGRCWIALHGQILGHSLVSFNIWKVTVCFWLTLVDRPTQLICISDIYLLSWRWRPLWSGGTLYQWSLRLKKASWVRFFFKISVLYTNCLWKSKKQDKKRAKNLEKKVFLSAPLTSWPSQATKVAFFAKKIVPFDLL